MKITEKCKVIVAGSLVAALMTGTALPALAASPAGDVPFAVLAQQNSAVTPEQVEALTGHAPGGVCPFAVKENTEIYLDISLKRFETVYPAAGSANSAVRLTIPELERYSCFQIWIDVCKEWETPLSQEEEKRKEC